MDNNPVALFEQVLAVAQDSDFQRLNRERDVAAYYVVGVVKGAIAFWEAQDFDATRAMLQRALDHFKAVDDRLTAAAAASTSIPPTSEVSKKENVANGNRTAA